MNQDFYQPLNDLHLQSSYTPPPEATTFGAIPYRDQTVTVYTLPSSVNSNPHILYLNESQQLVFLQLTIPDSESSNQLDKLDQAKNLYTLLYLPKTRAEQMYAFPENGMAYIVNDYTGQVMRLQKFLPESSKQFQANEGKNFHPVAQASPIIAITPTPSPTPIVIHRELTFSPALKLSMPIIMISSIIIILIRYRNRNNR